MIEFRRKFIGGVGILLGMFWVTEAIAVGYVPLSIDGNLSYSYGYASASNVESESTSIVFGVEMTGYIWQPWFITNSWGLSLGTSRTTSGSLGGGSSNYISGRFSFNVFPQSRVPFHISFSRGNSSFESNAAAQQITINEFTTSRLLIRQTYVGRASLYGNIIWSRVDNDSVTRGKSTNNTLNLNVRKRVPKHALTGNLNYSTNESDQTKTVPRRTNLSITHNFLPGTRVTQSSSLNYSLNSLSDGGTNESDSKSLQLASFFVWRPEYQSLSVSGGARLTTSETTATSAGVLKPPSTTRSFGLNLGSAYQLSTRVRVNGNASATLSEDSNKQSSVFSESGSLAFSSEQYSLLGFNYSYGTGFSLSNSNNEDDDGKKSDAQSASIGLTHRASRTWNVGRASNLNLGLSQGGSVSSKFDNESELNTNLSHSLNIGISTRGRSGTTFVAWSFSDTRTFAENQTVFQQFTMTMSRSLTINRSTSANAQGTVQTSRQTGDAVEDDKILSNIRMSARFRTSRFLGMYAMPYSSSMSYTRPIKDGIVGDEIIDWVNKVDYNIGLLSTGLSVRARKNGNLQPTFTMFFRATRTF